MRDVEKLINEGKALIDNHSEIDINAIEIYELYNYKQGEFYNQLINFYFAGVAIGHRIAKANNLKLIASNHLKEKKNS